MRKLQLTVMLTAIGITGSMLFAAEPATKPTTPVATTKDAKATPPSSQPAQAEGAKADATKPDPKPEPTAAPKSASATEAEGEKAPAATAADKGPSPQRFTPSEQVRADFDVSFPVDI